MRSELKPILLVVAVLSGGFCNLHSRFSPSFCKHDGLNPVEEGLSDTYVNCVRNGDEEVTAHHERCPIGQKFDSETLRCTTAEVSGRTRRMVKRAVLLPDLPFRDPIDCANRMFSCANCSAINVCARVDSNVFVHKKHIACTGEKPYCNPRKNACDKTLPEGCDSGFPCLSAGYFPDVKDCTIFHFCYTDPFTRRLRDAQGYCDKGYAFSGDLGGCKPMESNDTCHVARCPGDANGVYAFEGEPKYYVACEDGEAAFVAACPENQEFSPAKEECEVVCKGPGKIADPEFCGGYFECLATTKDGPPYKAIRKHCPWGLVYNATSAKCTVGDCWNYNPYPANGPQNGTNMEIPT